MSEENINPVSQEAPVHTPVPTPPPVSPVERPEGRVFSQAEVDHIVGGTRREMRERYERAAPERASAPQQQQAQPSSSPALTEEQVQKIFDDRAKQLEEKTFEHALAKTFVDKMQTGLAQENVPQDVVEKIGQLRIDSPLIKPVALLAGTMDGTFDIMLELADNPVKMGSLVNLASNPNTWHLAEAEMKKMSASIKANKAAPPRSAREPLTQISPSLTSTDSGHKTIKDWKNDPKYRF